MDDYILAFCPFCKARQFEDCIKIRGKNKGQRTESPHVVRAYAYFALTRTPLAVDQ